MAVATLSHLGTMPQNPDAETAILSAMLTSKEAADWCLANIGDEYFYMPAHRKVFQTITKMSGVIDRITLTDELVHQGELDRIGGTDFLDTLLNCDCRDGYRDYANILRACAVRRRAIAISAQISALAYDHCDPYEILDNAYRGFTALAEDLAGIKRHPQEDKYKF